MWDVLLRLSFTQIRKIAIFPILSQILVICNCKISNRSDKLFYFLILYSTTCLCKLSNRSDELFYPLILNGLFICYASYQIGQMDLISDIQRLAYYAKYWISQMTFDGPFAMTTGFSGDHRHRLYTTKVLANVWFTHLIGFIYRHHSNSCFKAIGGQGPISMMTRLTCMV